MLSAVLALTLASAGPAQNAPRRAASQIALRRSFDVLDR
jgi:hypothetical protein